MRQVLRYPGNKKRLAPTILEYIPRMDYYEPFVGAGSVLLSVAQRYRGVKLYASDLNESIVDYWKVVSDPSCSGVNKLISDIEDKWTITLDDWVEVRDSKPSAFRFIFLNMTSYNGYVHSGTGPIGGMKDNQKGKTWKVDCLWNPAKIISSIRNQHDLLKGRLQVKCEDMFSSDFWGDNFIYLDPPYYEQGASLYGEFGQFDHQALAERLRATEKNPWILSYDTHDEIRRLYKDFNIIVVSGFSGRKHSAQNELLISNREFERTQTKLW